MSLIAKNTLIVPQISMAKIEGSQTAQKTLGAVWRVFDLTCDETTKVIALTTCGLYQNTSDRPSHIEREKRFSQLVRFSDQWDKALDLKKDVSAESYGIVDWDALVRQTPNTSRLLRRAMNALKSISTNNNVYGRQLRALSASFNREADASQLSYFNEEFALNYLIISGQIDFPDVDRSEIPNTCLLYNGKMTIAELYCYKFLEQRMGKQVKSTFSYCDISDPDNPVFYNYRSMMDNFNPSCESQLYL